MTAAELQRLYRSDMKKALNKIHFIPEILCEVDPTDLRYGLLQQLGASETTPTVTQRLWLPCDEGKDNLARRFTTYEVEQALQHKNSASGSDGWTYDTVRRQKDFAKKFVEGIHAMGQTSLTSDCWRTYNSMLLFKKPED